MCSRRFLRFQEWAKSFESLKSFNPFSGPRALKPFWISLPVALPTRSVFESKVLIINYFSNFEAKNSRKERKVGKLFTFSTRNERKVNHSSGFWWNMKFIRQNLVEVYQLRFEIKFKAFLVEKQRKKSLIEIQNFHLTKAEKFLKN